MSQQLLKSTVVTGGMTLTSRIAGLVRDVVLANFIGASAAADAFYVAFRIPNFFRRIFAEGAFSQAFVPVFTEYKTQRGTDATRRFAGHVAGRFGLILFVITLVGMIAAPLLVSMLAPGFLIKHPDKYAQTVQMLRITFPYLMFISLVAMAAGILNSHGRFAVAAFTPVLLNLVLIAAALGLAPHMAEPVLALAWGVFIAGFVQLLFQLPFLWRIGMLPRPRLGRDEGVRRVFRLMGPAIFGSSVSQINMLVNTILASFLVTGSVSWLYYADRLMEFPLGVFGIALATVILPSLSREHTANSPQRFSDILDWAMRWALIIGLPATVGLVVLAEPIITTLFRYGVFTDSDVNQSALALVAFAFGLPGFILIKVLAPGFYARHDTATPAKIAAVAFTLNIVLSLILVFPLQHVGLALAISLAAYVNAGLLYFRLYRMGVLRPLRGWFALIVRVVLACGAMGGVLACVRGDLVIWLTADVIERIVRLGFWIILAIMVYVVSIGLLGLRPRQLKLRHEANDQT